MKNNNMNTFIIVAGVMVLAVFTTVMVINLKPNYESSSYYVKVEDEMSAKIESLTINSGKLKIVTSGDAVEYCVKSTRTNPGVKNMCWKTINNNEASISIYKYKKYYVWIKDAEGNISNPMSINTRK